MVSGVIVKVLKAYSHFVSRQLGTGQCHIRPRFSRTIRSFPVAAGCYKTGEANHQLGGGVS
jgi:hypothetical protein